MRCLWCIGGNGNLRPCFFPMTCGWHGAVVAAADRSHVRRESIDRRHGLDRPRFLLHRSMHGWQDFMRLLERTIQAAVAPTRRRRVRICTLLANLPREPAP